MAKHSWATEAGLTGTVGPMVICRGSTGAYIRQRIKPKNPKTDKQLDARGKLRDAVLAWRALTPAEKRTYNERATWHGRTGYNLFVSQFLGGKAPTPATETHPSGGLPPRELLAACLEAVLRVAADGRTDALQMALEALTGRSSGA